MECVSPSHGYRRTGAGDQKFDLRQGVHSEAAKFIESKSNTIEEETVGSSSAAQEHLLLGSIWLLFGLGQAGRKNLSELGTSGSYL
jgi:hypothetical protein